MCQQKGESRNNNKSSAVMKSSVIWHLTGNSDPTSAWGSARYWDTEGWWQETCCSCQSTRPRRKPIRSHSHLLISHPEAFEQLANPPPPLAAPRPCNQNPAMQKCYNGKERKKEKKTPPNKYFPKEAKHSNPLQPSGTLLLLWCD